MRPEVAGASGALVVTGTSLAVIGLLGGFDLSKKNEDESTTMQSKVEYPYRGTILSLAPTLRPTFSPTTSSKPSLAPSLHPSLRPSYLPSESVSIL